MRVALLEVSVSNRTSKFPEVVDLETDRRPRDGPSTSMPGVSALREWRLAQLEELLRAGEAWGSGDWIVTDVIGRLLPPDRVGDLFRRIADTAGLPALTIRLARPLSCDASTGRWK